MGWETCRVFLKDLQGISALRPQQNPNFNGVKEKKAL